MGRSRLTLRMGKSKQGPAHSPEFGWGTAGIEDLSASQPPLVIPLSQEPMVTNRHRTKERKAAVLNESLSKVKPKD